MPTPSSGAISWSQIQAQTGGAYSMSNFNAVTGRGYDASDYYNYPPVATCYQYYVYDYGIISYRDCYGNDYDDYFYPGAQFCAETANGPCYVIGTCSV